MPSLETFPNKIEGITVKSVEDFYEFKSKLRTSNDEDSLVQVCTEEGITLDDQAQDASLTEFRKTILNRYLDLHFSKESSKSIAEQREKQELNIKKLTEYLGRKNSKSLLWVGGSFGTGKTKSNQSDLDLFFALPKLADADAISEEASIFENLNDIGFIIVEKQESIDGVVQALKSGRGLARLSGMTKDCVELDFHCIGIDDLKDMDKLSPGGIERIRKTEDYFESRISFKGNHKVLPKLGAKLFNYLDSDNEMFKGFYPDNFSAGARLSYDPKGEGEKISDNLWRAIVKAYIFHNHGYTKDATGKVRGIDRDHVSFEGFLKTLHYQSGEEYSEERLKYLKDKYNQTLEDIRDKFHLV